MNTKTSRSYVTSHYSNRFPYIKSHVWKDCGDRSVSVSPETCFGASRGGTVTTDRYNTSRLMLLVKQSLFIVITIGNM